MQPILDGVCAATGWKATFIAGGPEPADDGRINILRYVVFLRIFEVSLNSSQQYSLWYDDWAYKNDIWSRREGYI
jgi:hypothetical protein